ncbi:MAG: hypothetical protein ACJ8GN_13305 [Longimicrobiaceae bacterium]
MIFRLRLLGRGEVLLAVGVFAVAFLSSSSGAVPSPEVTLRWRPDPGAAPPPTGNIMEGPELAMIFIGASTCRASNHEGLPAAVEQLARTLRGKAKRAGRSFTTVGVARDWDVDAGLAHLRKFGRFDEVISGRNWLNSGLLHYVWEDIPGEAATPQVVVVDRRLVDRHSSAAEGGMVQDERLVARLVGWKEIRQWAERGAPLPDLPPVPARTRDSARVSALPSPP